jgi:hypothetical protein
MLGDAWANTLPAMPAWPNSASATSSAINRLPAKIARPAGNEGRDLRGPRLDNSLQKKPKSDMRGPSSRTDDSDLGHLA